jgi:hypothetical protein
MTYWAYPVPVGDDGAENLKPYRSLAVLEWACLAIETVV